VFALAYALLLEQNKQTNKQNKTPHFFLDQPMKSKTN